MNIYRRILKNVYDSLKIIKINIQSHLFLKENNI